MSKEPFDKDIELAKLQARISEWQTRRYTMIATMYGIIVSMVVLWATLTDPTVRNLLYVMWAFFMVLLVVAIHYSEKWGRIRMRGLFEDIYNGKRIDI